MHGLNVYKLHLPFKPSIFFAGGTIMTASNTAQPYLLSSREAAQILKVNPSSVKRWADEGRLPCFRTPGGHRRFERVHVESFRKDHQKQDAKAWHQSLLEVLIEGRQGEAEAMLMAKRAALGRWEDVGDDIGLMLHELGSRWVAGEVSICQEHVATECLLRCINRILHLFPRSDNARVCALASAPGDDHTLGLAISELILAEHGWNSMWLGRMCPIDTLQDVAKLPSIEMLAVSGSMFSSQPSELGDLVRTLGPVCMAHDTQLVLGGHASWPEDVFDLMRVRSFSEFGHFLRFVS
jgi:excisionase family DNA binding protein